MNLQKLCYTDDNNLKHVVLLGAGASLAAFPNGDKNGKKLPLMNNLAKTLRIKTVLKKNNINPDENFETIYNQLSDNDTKVQIETKIVNYFSKLELPKTVTIYDQLLLSLREKDAIFTFNWDPFLFDAYQRNRNVAPLPHIYFLHGNVRIGACESCDTWGMKSILCPMCGIKFKDVPLLYPIEKKRYFESSRYTSMSWSSAQCWFSEAFTMTIFGYSVPASDQEAVELLKKAWFRASERNFEHVEVIDILDSNEVFNNWTQFTPTQHLKLHASFKESRIWCWPRRSCEALYHSMSRGAFSEKFPLPEISNLEELQKTILEISQYEN